MEIGFILFPLFATSLAGLACSLVGVTVVTMGLSFIGVCMSHAAFAGALVGIFSGLNPLLCSFFACFATAGVLGPLSERSEIRPDTALGIIFSATLGVAFLMLPLIPGAKSEGLRFLWGSVLTVGSRELFVELVVCAIVIVGIFIFYKEIQSIVFNRTLASASGIPVRPVFNGLLFLTGASIAASLTVVGGLLVFALIVNPAAAAYQLTYDLKKMYVIAALLGLASGWTGLLVSFFLNIPTGAPIALASVLFFLLAVIASPKRRRQRSVK
ncbi:MAG: metal ABC transporter permease [Candidatus Ratteibacteria bacterium]|jgi:manganese/iron transport system permease protein